MAFNREKKAKIHIYLNKNFIQIHFITGVTSIDNVDSTGTFEMKLKMKC